MKKTFYRKFGISIIAGTLLASLLSTVSALDCYFKYRRGV